MLKELNDGQWEGRKFEIKMFGVVIARGIYKSVEFTETTQGEETTINMAATFEADGDYWCPWYKMAWVRLCIFVSNMFGDGHWDIEDA